MEVMDAGVRLLLQHTGQCPTKLDHVGGQAVTSLQRHLQQDDESHDTGVNITAFEQEIPLFDRHPALQLKCPTFCVFRIEHAMHLFASFCVLSLFEI